MQSQEPKYASNWKRFIAYIIDIIPITLIIFAIAYFFFGFNEVLKVFVENRQNLQARLEYLTYRNSIRSAALVFWIIYSTILDASKFNGTLGKYCMGIKVVDENGNSLTITRSIFRNVAKILSAIVLFLGFIWIIFSKKKQGWHDMIAGTFVVKRQN